MSAPRGFHVPAVAAPVVAELLDVVRGGVGVRRRARPGAQADPILRDGDLGFPYYARVERDREVGHLVGIAAQVGRRRPHAKRPSGDLDPDQVLGKRQGQVRARDQVLTIARIVARVVLGASATASTASSGIWKRTLRIPAILPLSPNSPGARNSPDSTTGWRADDAVTPTSPPRGVGGTPSSDPMALLIAQTILDGFDLHYWLFREYSARAREHFERGEWAAAWDTNRARIDMYDRRVAETVETVLCATPTRAPMTRSPARRRPPPRPCGRASSCPISACSTTTCSPSAPRPSTTRSPVACCTAAYYHNAYIFFRPAISTSAPGGTSPPTAVITPHSQGLKSTLFATSLRGFGLPKPLRGPAQGPCATWCGRCARHPPTRCATS